ncbi:hypothetical protein [Brevibacillus sp. SYSU BS000544]|uniref:hypothetical protein n=1 Tax=Brevibacillus sp. SYSU BS000544 TaxID=3416443 RepID=UPI003CE56DE8
MDRKSAKAMINWDIDPSNLPTNEWIRDIVMNTGEIRGNRIYGDTWTVLVRITSHINGTWDTFADVAFIVDEAPWHLLKKDYTFTLWSGKDIATVTII